ncbi:hypothetical protein JCM10908_003842 [Rhodotorula pacifica]|uniref:uncharacterized protein n=1 Tax=Rhodotorula pacifica TaxID=1495444 RepID=UPI0031701EC6
MSPSPGHRPSHSVMEDGQSSRLSSTIRDASWASLLIDERYDELGNLASSNGAAKVKKEKGTLANGTTGSGADIPRSSRTKLDEGRQTDDDIHTHANGADSLHGDDLRIDHSSGNGGWRTEDSGDIVSLDEDEPRAVLPPRNKLTYGQRRRSSGRDSQTTEPPSTASTLVPLVHSPLALNEPVPSRHLPSGLALADGSSEAQTPDAGPSTPTGPRFAQSQQNGHYSTSSVGSASPSHDGSAWSQNERYLGSRRKGKARAERRAAVEDGPPPNDPLNPVSAMHLSHSASTAAIASMSKSMSKRRLASPSRPDAVLPADVRPQPQRPSSPTSDTYTKPPSYPSNSSFHSTPPRASSRASGSSAQTRPDSQQPSLQQLLQEIDLGAALKLVQGLQTQQQLQARLKTAVGNDTPAKAAVPSAGAVIQPIDTDLANTAGSAGFIASPTVIDFSTASSSPTKVSALSTGEEPAPRSDSKPTNAALARIAEERPLARERRGSLMGGLQKRLRTNSGIGKSVSMGSVGSQPLAGRLDRAPSGSSPVAFTGKSRKASGRVLTEEQARTLDDQISRVHLSLSPATLQRAQNCAKYLSLRYTPVYAALSASVPPPNPLEVARWRVRRDEEDKRARRTELSRGVGSRLKHARTGSRDINLLAMDGANRLSTLGSIKAGMAPSPFGPRRNKNPKVWELYPDDLADYVAAEGKTAADSAASHADANAEDWRRGKYVAIDVDSLFHHPNAPQWKRPIAADDPLLPRLPAARTASPDTRETLSPPMRSLRSSAMSTASSSDAAETRSPTMSTTRSSLIRSPALPRQTSFEGAPVNRISKSVGVPSDNFPGSPLRRTTSLTGAAAGIAQARRANTHAAGQEYGGAGLLNSKTDQPSDGFRHGLSRRLDRMRGRGEHDSSREYVEPRNDSIAESAHFLGSPSRRFDSPIPSVINGGGNASDTSRRARLSKMRKNHTSADLPRASGFDSDNMVRSSGDEGSARMVGGVGSGVTRSAWLRASRGILGGAWQNLKTSIDNYPDPHALPSPRQRLGTAYFENGYPGVCPAHAIKANMPRCPEADDSEDEEGGICRPPPREVIDLNDDDYSRVSGLARQIRADSVLVEDTVTERVVALNRFLDELNTHAESTSVETRSPSNVISPRLPAAILKEIAFTKEHPLVREPLPNDLRESDEDSDVSSATSASSSSSPSSSSEWSTSSSSSSAASANPQHRRQRTRPRAPKPSLAQQPRLPRRRESEVALRAVHNRSVTDPPTKPVPARPRSQTIAAPALPRALHRPPIAQTSTADGFADRTRSTQIRHAEPLVVLERALHDLTSAADDLEQDAKGVIREQEGVDAKINEVLSKVNDAQQTIDREDFQRLRMLEDHYFRLRTALSRPSTSLDFLWTGLSYVLVILFWLSWFVVTVFRTIRTVLLFPITVLRWLLFLH